MYLIGMAVVSQQFSVGTWIIRSVVLCVIQNDIDSMLEMSFKSNSTLQNWFVKWGLYFSYILWNCFISNQCETSNNYPL